MSRSRPVSHQIGGAPYLQPLCPPPLGWPPSPQECQRGRGRAGAGASLPPGAPAAAAAAAGTKAAPATLARLPGRSAREAWEKAAARPRARLAPGSSRGRGLKPRGGRREGRGTATLPLHMPRGPLPSRERQRWAREGRAARPLQGPAEKAAATCLHRRLQPLLGLRAAHGAARGEESGRRRRRAAGPRRGWPGAELARPLHRPPPPRGGARLDPLAGGQCRGVAPARRPRERGARKEGRAPAGLAARRPRLPRGGRRASSLPPSAPRRLLGTCRPPRPSSARSRRGSPAAARHGSRPAARSSGYCPGLRRLGDPSGGCGRRGGWERGPRATLSRAPVAVAAKLGWPRKLRVALVPVRLSSSPRRSPTEQGFATAGSASPGKGGQRCPRAGGRARGTERHSGRNAAAQPGSPLEDRQLPGGGGESHDPATLRSAASSPFALAGWGREVGRAGRAAGGPEGVLPVPVPPATALPACWKE